MDRHVYKNERILNFETLTHTTDVFYAYESMNKGMNFEENLLFNRHAFIYKYISRWLSWLYFNLKLN